jgi:hypothetical protein
MHPDLFVASMETSLVGSRNLGGTMEAEQMTDDPQTPQKTPCSHCKSLNTDPATGTCDFGDGRVFNLIGTYCYDCDDISEDFEANKEYHDAQAEEAERMWEKFYEDEEAAERKQPAVEA